MRTVGRRGAKSEPLVLTDDERAVLEGWGRRHTTAQALALRCRIVLACTEPGSNVEIGRRLGVSDDTEVTLRLGDHDGGQVRPPVR